MLSLLDAIEEQLETLHLRAVFADGYEAALVDVQIYPSAKKVSFQMGKVASRTGSAEQSAAADALQRPLVPRSRFRARLSASVIAPRKLGVSYWVKVPVG